MKKLISVFSFILVLNVISMSNAMAQKSRYAPETGHYQLVSNKHQKNIVLVQFYNDNNEMMHEESLDRKLNINKTKVRKQLYFALKEANDLYVANKKVQMLQGLMAKRH